jgi:hypothetical protein
LLSLAVCYAILFHKKDFFSPPQPTHHRKHIRMKDLNTRGEIYELFPSPLLLLLVGG